MEANSRWEYDDLPYWGGEVDCCINSFTLANGTWLGADVADLEEWFKLHTLSDGGWNCDWVQGSKRSSFHSTLNSLRGLLYRESATGDESLRPARLAAQEYLLERRLLYSRHTGEPVGEWATRFSYPFRWQYSILRALDYFRDASLHDGAPPDPRLADAIDILRAAQLPDGTWLQQAHHPGAIWFEIDVAQGRRSKWLSFHGIRVLDWWDAANEEP